MEISTTMTSFTCRTILAIALLVGAIETSSAETFSFTTKVDSNGEFPLLIAADEKVSLSANFNLLFESIERVCVTGKIKVGTARSLLFEVVSEPAGPLNPPIGVGQIQPFIYLDDSPTLAAPLEPKFCDSTIVPGNFLDGQGEFKFLPSGGYLEFWEVEVEVQGTLSSTQVDVELKSNDTTVPFYGGKLKYKAKIQNLDNDESRKAFTYWSFVRFPNGDIYPLRKPKTVELDYAEALVFNTLRVKVPEWFEAGEYELVWTVADMMAETRVEDAVRFTKE